MGLTCDDDKSGVGILVAAPTLSKGRRALRMTSTDVSRAWAILSQVTTPRGNIQRSCETSRNSMTKSNSLMGVGKGVCQLERLNLLWYI